MKKNFRYVFTIMAISSVFVACVPKRQLDDMEAKYNAEKSKAKELHDRNLQVESKNNELTASIAEMEKRLIALERDTTIQGTSLRQLTKNYDQLDKTYRELLELQEKIKQGNASEAKRLLKEIEETRISIIEKEDKLNELQRSLKEKESSLNQLSTELEKSRSQLAAREKKVAELQDIIDRQDSATKALKAKISAALLGLENNGLTIEMKNGKVYVSLDNELLFKPGSYDVDPKGKDALKRLADALNQNPEISIAVEGHTDIDKYRGSGQLKDNWDLSVIRATQIVKILEGYNVDPKRLTASGRGEFQPLDPNDSAEAKKKNRRTEIILTPKLDELFNIIGN